ncbi:MAG: C39 family peptidase [Nitrospirota bacterium]
MDTVYDRLMTKHRILHFFFLSLIVVLFVTTSCTSMQTLPEPKDVHLIRNVPFYEQEAYQCGPASLSNVLNYWGIRVTPEQIAEEIFSKSARGTLTIDMILYAQRAGLRAEQYRGDIGDIKKKISGGFPLIVLVDYGFSFYKQHHFMVIVGYAEQGVIVHSGKTREKLIPWNDFMKTWEKTEYWTLLVKKSKQ